MLGRALALVLAASSAAAAPIPEIQRAVAEAGLDAWLFYDFRGSDPIAARVLGLDPKSLRTRRWYYLVPARGTPRKLVHAIEPRALDGLPGEARTYASWQARHKELQALLRGHKKIAMQYSPQNDIPYVATVDAGTIELVRKLGAQVLTSADLVARFEATLTAEELASQASAAAALTRAVDATFAEIGRCLGTNTRITEREAQLFLLDRYEKEDLKWEEPPNVSADAHAADPHYEVPEQGSAEIRAGSVILIDAWATHGGIYGDVTRMAYAGAAPPAEVTKIFATVTRARDAALSLLRARLAAGKAVTGAELDRAARAVIDAAGHGAHFIHRTGHNIGRKVHGNGAHLDDYETHDTRRILPSTCFSIEPGIYLAGRFGARSEIDVCVIGKEAVVTGGPPQEALTLLP